MRTIYAAFSVVLAVGSLAKAETTSGPASDVGLDVPVEKHQSISANDPRPFTMVEDTYPEGAGAFELENTFSYNHRTRNDHGFNALDIEHEFEYGVNDNLDLKVPIAYGYESSADGDSTHFDSAAVQFDLYLANSYTDPVGIAIIGEAGVGEGSLSFETTLVVQKDFGDWVIAYNLGAETGIDGVFRSDQENEVTGLWINSLGAAYSLTGDLRVGAQVSAESTYADWSRYDGTTVYAGPTINYFGGSWWLTIGPSAQLTSSADEPEYRLDLILAVGL